MSRIKLEPSGRFAMIVVGAHVLVGVGILIWFTTRKTEIQESPAQNLTWISPSDFAKTTEPVAAQTAPEPSTTKATEPEKPKPAEPPPAPATAPVAMTAPTPAAPEDNLPKAIAIDPEKAAEIMAKAAAAEQAAAASKAGPAPAKEPEKPSATAGSPGPAKAPAPAEAEKAVAAAPEPKPEPPPAPKQEPKPAPVVASPRPEARPMEPSGPPPPGQPATDVSRFITVSHPPPPKTADAPKTASLLDVASLDKAGTGVAGDKSGIRLDDVDRAIIDVFMRNWTPPSASKLRIDQRSAHVNVQVTREGVLKQFQLIKTSGSAELDDSVLEAANRLANIGVSLPASYPHDLYEFQVNFHVE